MRSEKFLTLDEIRAVVRDLRSRRSTSARWRLILFRLSLLRPAGGRKSATLNGAGSSFWNDHVQGIVVRRETTKGVISARSGSCRCGGTVGRTRTSSWAARMPKESFVLPSGSTGDLCRRTHPGAIAKGGGRRFRFLTSRQKQVSIHQGRHFLRTQSTPATRWRGGA